MSKATEGFLILVGILIIAGMCFGGSAVEAIFHSNTTTGEEIAMLQPGGWNLNRDEKASQINLNNSQANAQNGQLYVERAQATAIVGASQQMQAQNIQVGIQRGVIGSIFAVSMCVIISFVVILGVILSYSKKYSPTSESIMPYEE